MFIGYTSASTRHTHVGCQSCNPVVLSVQRIVDLTDGCIACGVYIFPNLTRGSSQLATQDTQSLLLLSCASDEVQVVLGSPRLWIEAISIPGPQRLAAGTLSECRHDTVVSGFPCQHHLTTVITNSLLGCTVGLCVDHISIKLNVSGQGRHSSKIYLMIPVQRCMSNILC